MAERFGKVLKGALQQNWGAGNIQFCKFTSGSAGYLESISVFLFGANPLNIKCAIYDSSKNFIAGTEERAFATVPQGWRLFRLDFDNPPLVSATTVYWLACWLSADICAFFYDAGAIGQANMKFYAYDGWPSPFVDAVVQNRDYSMFATYRDLTLFGYPFKAPVEHTGKDNIKASKFRSKQAGTLDSISVYLKYSTAIAKVKCAIYDAGWNLLVNGTTEEKQVTVGQDGWMTFNFATPPTVAEQTFYNLAFWTGDNACKSYYEQFSEDDQYSWKAKVYNGWDDPLVIDGSVDYMYSIYANYREEPPGPPTAPTSPHVDGKSSPIGANCIATINPQFSAIFNDPDAGDQSNAIQIQVGSASGLSDMWDSGWLADSTTEGNRCSDKTYAGAALSTGTSYWWRCRFRDDDNEVGVWSAWQQFDVCAEEGRTGAGTEASGIGSSGPGCEPGGSLPKRLAFMCPRKNPRKEPAYRFPSCS